MTTVTTAPPEMRDFVDSVRRCVTRVDPAVLRSRDELSLPRSLWRSLGALGVLGLGGAAGEAGWMLAAYRELGAALCPGPLVAAAMAPLLLDDAGDVDAVRSGERIVAVGADGVFPWGVDADVLVAIGHDAAHLLDAAAPRRAMTTLGREPWARIDAAPLRALPGARRAVAVGDLAVSALLLGAARRLLDMAAEHARTRVQFGRAIGAFQAVAFPLAAGHAALHNSSCLARQAAEALDGATDSDVARAVCAAARTVSTMAALDVAATAHQAHGATGFTEESPVAAYSTRIRQWTLLPPAPSSARDAMLHSIGAQDGQQANTESEQ